MHRCIKNWAPGVVQGIGVLLMSLADVRTSSGDHVTWVPHWLTYWVLVLLHIWKSCKQTDSGRFIKICGFGFSFRFLMKVAILRYCTSVGARYWLADAPWHVELAYTPVNLSAHPRRIPVSDCASMSSHLKHTPLTPGQITLDDNQKFDYGIFSVRFRKHCNRLSLPISARKTNPNPRLT